MHALPGSIVITNPNEVHATVCDTVTGSSFFTFYVSPDILTGLNNGVPVFFADKIIDDPTLFRQLMLVSIRLNAGDEKAEKVFLALLQQLINAYSINNLSLSKKQQLFQRFLNEENMENFSLTETARQFGLDKYKFLRLFKQETGLTPNNYIILKRIEKCKSLLHTNNDLLDIAIQTGFYDATHLCRHFKRITGVTPQTYREA